jgi:putative transcriptional regulator
MPDPGDDGPMTTMTGRLTGQLLVAAPTLLDPNFHRTVVLLLDHGDDGALGLVVNRPMEIDVGSVLPAWQPYATAPGRLFQGGPVQPDSALGLVAVPGGDQPTAVRRIVGSLGLVDLDSEPTGLLRGVSGFRVFAGYAGWSSGQVEREIEEGAWFVVGSEARDAFSDAPHVLWRQVLRRQRDRLALVSTFPEDPTLN